MTQVSQFNPIDKIFTSEPVVTGLERHSKLVQIFLIPLGIIAALFSLPSRKILNATVLRSSESLFKHAEGKVDAKAKEALQKTDLHNFGHADHLLFKKCLKLNVMIQSESASVQKIYASLDRLTSSKEYLNLQAENRHDPAVQFLHELCFVRWTGPESSQIFEELAEEFSDRDTSGSTWEDFANHLDQCVLSLRTLSGQTLLDRLFLNALHPRRAYESIRGHSFGKEVYNPLPIGNRVMGNGSFGNAKFTHMPGPTNQPTFKAYLRYLEDRGKIHIHHNLQHPKVPGEYERSKMLLELQKEFPNTFYLYSSPMDGPSMKMDAESVDAFMRSYEEFALQGLYEKELSKESTGFYVHPMLLSEAEFTSAFAQVRERFSHISVRGQSLEQRQRLFRSLALMTQAIISLKVLEKRGSEAFYFSQACKQDIDRGVVVNVAMRMLYDLERGAIYTREDRKRIIGTVLGRAGMVERRGILNGRYQILSDFIRLLPK